MSRQVVNSSRHPSLSYCGRGGPITLAQLGTTGGSSCLSSAGPRNWWMRAGGHCEQWSITVGGVVSRQIVDCRCLRRCVHCSVRVDADGPEGFRQPPPAISAAPAMAISISWARVASVGALVRAMASARAVRDPGALTCLRSSDHGLLENHSLLTGLPITARASLRP